jgi:CRISPR-associated protein Csc1
MRLYVCRLTFHENLFYASREIGRLYETGRYLHNYALTYALGMAVAPYFHRQQVPCYKEELLPLNKRGIYVTPARGVNVQYEPVTFKHANNAYHVKMEPGSRNTPSFGRAKEVATGSQFEFAVISREALRLPRWVRMGLWQSKALVECLGQTEPKQVPLSENVANLPLNPLDVDGELRVYDLISMPPSSLVENAMMYTEWLHAEVEGRTILLPARMSYNFPGKLDRGNYFNDK